MAYLIAYFVIGMLVVAWFGFRRHRPREKEIFGIVSFLVFDLNPISVLLGIAAWPVWLLFQLIPERLFPRHEATKPEPLPPPASSPPPPSWQGRQGTVIIPLNPVGRIEIDGRFHDARTDFHPLAEGTRVEVVAQSVARELRVRAVEEI